MSLGTWLHEWIARIKAGAAQRLRERVVEARDEAGRRQHEVEQAREELREQWERLKQTKANPMALPQAVANEEWGVGMAEEKVTRKQKALDEAERHLQNLDPDGSIRASLPPP